MNIPEIASGPEGPLARREKKILEFWKKNKIFEKSLKKPIRQAQGKKGDFVFYDGPPFATGTPHYGHIVASLMKDIVPRYWTMQGYRVERKWGWDCHGLPIENIVEKEMNLKDKKDIEKIGIDKFNEACRSKVLMFAEEWRKVIDRLGRWADMDNDYKTMDLDYMESIWWVFKQLWDKGLIYKGYKPMHVCPRCETTLSQSEVAQGYKDIKETSITLKFELVDEPGTYILAWTTTPWTLPGNVALAVGKNIDYIKFSLKNHSQISDGIYITSKKDLENAKEEIEKIKILERLKGKDLIGLEYKPLFPDVIKKIDENSENAFKVYPADFVTTEDGTGVVHTAVMYGLEDYELGEQVKLPKVHSVNLNGTFNERVVQWKGKFVKDVEKEIVSDLKKRDLLFLEEDYEHSYPHCWRCESPLLNYATSSWFVKVTELKDKMLKYAKNINWVPKHVKGGRFGKWLEGVKDWSISRQRFWGSVIPIWICDKCKEKKVFGSIKELEKASGKKIKDLHKHFVDKIELKCKCKGKMKRIPDVLDCWFESGSMPYAQMHYPFENKEKFEKNFPAQFIAEGVDQTRTWFYYLHVLATAIKNKKAYENVIANGMVLAEDGKKMSKRLGNYPEPMDVFNKYGADAVRYYLVTSQVMKAEDLNFSEKGVDEAVKKVILILLNIFSFYKMYEQKTEVRTNSNNVLDKWILSRVESLKKEIADAYNKYDLNKASRPIEPFINELSTWYLRRSRERIKNNDRKAAETLKYVLLELSKIIAPAIPFIADYIYRELKGEKESVHLEDWPKVNQKLIDKELEEKMKKVREICSGGLQKRVEAGIKVRQVLSRLSIPKYKLGDELSGLIRDEVNVQKVVPELKQGVKLDTKITPELKEQGLVREFIRQIQAERKKQGLIPKDKIKVYFTDDKLKRIVEKNRDQIKKQVIAEDIVFGKEFKIEKI